MLFKKLNDYSKENVCPMHMPGHKRNILFSNNKFPFDIDITEIDGFDNLHNSNGVILNDEKSAAKLYSVDKSFFLINGSTGGILATVRALTNYGDTVLVARNCHKSVYNAIDICGLNAIYVQPEIDTTFGISGSVSPSKIENILLNNTNIKLIVLTSPTYEGVISDIKSISTIAHKYNIPLFVDEAHGAHLPFLECENYEAINNGADVATLGLHKTLPVLTQCALLNIKSELVDVDKINEQLSIFETSSPSYVLMSSIDECISKLFSKKKTLFEEYQNKLKKLNEHLLSLNNIAVLCYGDDSLTKHKNIFLFDYGKIVISTRQTNITGKELSDILRERFSIEIEMFSTNYVVAMTSVCDSEENINRLENALICIDREVSKSGKSKTSYCYKFTAPNKYCKISYATNMYGEFSLLNNSKNRVSLEYVFAYPPGIPIIVPGEIITEDVIEQIKYLTENNILVNSTKNQLPNKIFVSGNFINDN